MIPEPQSFAITGMTCGNCVTKIQQRLAEHPDVESVAVTLQPPAAEMSARRPLTAAELNDWITPLGHYRMSLVSALHMVPPQTRSPVPGAATYRPLIILVGYLLAVTAGVLVATGGWDPMLAMRVFMGGFFIAFSFFKMLDLRGFADAYGSYDLVAKAWPGYGYVYPFIEFGLGLAYVCDLNQIIVNSITAVVMAVSLAGVLLAVRSKRAIRCACLGTVFNLPMSTVTVIEDGTMLAMSVAMLLA